MTDSTDLSDLGTVGEVNCVCIDVCHGWGDTWQDQVLQRLRRAVRAGVPVVYVDSGGYDLNTEIVRSELGPTPLLLTVKDDDPVMLVPTPDGPTPCEAVSYGTPTFTVAEKAVESHEQRFGPAMLVIDELDFARPFAGIDDETPSAEHSDNLAHTVITLTPLQVQQWRANELTRIARQRPTRPTLVVTRSCRVANTLSAVPPTWL